MNQTKANKRIALDVGLVVKDMAQALHFYRDLIGLNLVAELTTSLIGQGRMAQLQYGSSLIKLIEFDESSPSSHSYGIQKASGYRYITFLVLDIHAVMAKLTKAQIPISIPLTELGNGTLIAMVEDPEGNIVEFVQEV